jgi:L-rhamnose mutarotase
MTDRYAFKMFRNPGCAAEYRRRHDVIWPELSCVCSERVRRQLLDSSGSGKETSTLFAYLDKFWMAGL